MNPNEPKDETQARTTETVTAESEQITGKFAIDLVLLDEAFADDGNGRTPDEVVSVKRRIREAVDSADQS
jgi:hypothetical protein